MVGRRQWTVGPDDALIDALGIESLAREHARSVSSWV